jgi:uncharacterized alpha-E superfamily protein
LASLLARFASNIFWLGRYIERAENVARILDIHETYAHGSATDADWQRVLELYADTDGFFAKHDEANAANVLNFYIIDRDNPTSVAVAVRSARENARSLRHLISTEMWIRLNMFHNRLAALSQRDLRLNNVAVLCAEIKEACQTFEGVAEGTFLRGEPWCFYQMGKYLERADQSTRVLDIGFSRVADGQVEGLDAIHWNILLRSVAGYHAFRSRYPEGPDPSNVAMFLLYDDEFPRSVRLCIDRLSDRLLELEGRHDHRRHAAVEEARRTLAFKLETGPGKRLSGARMHKFLDDMQVALGGVADAIGEHYFRLD